MKRRSILAMLGLAPVAAVSVSVVARATTPNDYLREIISNTFNTPIANIGSVTGGAIHSADRNMTIDLSAGTFTSYP